MHHRLLMRTVAPCHGAKGTHLLSVVKAASNMQAPCLDAVRNLLPELGRIITQLRAQMHWINSIWLSRRPLAADCPSNNHHDSYRDAYRQGDSTTAVAESRAVFIVFSLYL